MLPALTAAGFDIVHRFDAAAVSRALSPASDVAIVEPARPVGVLVGNTRALWPIFLAARRADPALLASPVPIQRYTEQTIDAIAAAHGGRALYSHRTYDGAFAPFQRIAVAAGLGSLAPTGLLIHPTFGPWFALRAIILVAGEPPVNQPARPACECGAPCTEALARALASRNDWRAWLAVRDACPVGRAYRYDDDQLRYHYTKDRSLLR